MVVQDHTGRKKDGKSELGEIREVERERHGCSKLKDNIPARKETRVTKEKIKKGMEAIKL